MTPVLSTALSRLLQLLDHNQMLPHVCIDESGDGFIRGCCTDVEVGPVMYLNPTNPFPTIPFQLHNALTFHSCEHKAPGLVCKLFRHPAETSFAETFRWGLLEALIIFHGTFAKGRFLYRADLLLCHFGTLPSAFRYPPPQGPSPSAPRQKGCMRAPSTWSSLAATFG